MAAQLPVQDEVDPVAIMFEAFAAQNFPLVAQAALEVEARALAIEDDDEEEFGRTLAAFGRCMHHYALAVPAAVALQFAEARRHFDEARRALSSDGSPAMPDELRVLTRLIDMSSSISMPLLDAQENLLLGNLQASQKSITVAGTKLRQAIAALPEPDGGEEAVALRSAVIWNYLGFYIAGTMIHMATGPVLGNTGLSLKFVEEHEAGLGQLIDGVQQGPEILGAVDSLRMLGRAAAVALRADAAIAKGHYEEAVALFGEARDAFWNASSDIPDAIPFAAKIRDACFNRATMMPQAERYAALLRKEGEAIVSLEEENAALKDKIRGVERDYFDRLKDFAQQRLNLTIDSKNINQLENQVSNEISVNQSNLQMIQDRSLDQLLVLLEAVRNASNEGEVRDLKKEVSDTRQEKDLAKKIERISGILDAVGGLAEAASELVPYGRTVYRAVRGILVG